VSHGDDGGIVAYERDKRVWTRVLVGTDGTHKAARVSMQDPRLTAPA
jgi:hypothetical protein